jgi:hypothetical protein
MSEEKKAETSEIVNGLGVLAAIICSFLGYAHGQWVGAIVAAGVAYGGVWLAFHAINLALRITVMGAVLILILASLKNRWDWLAGLVQ